MTLTSTPLLTSKQVAAIGDLPLEGGGTLADVHIGYETYGTLSPAADNAVLICHFFSGASHAAGRYSPEDPVPGWWDAVIGPGKAIDTDRYFVVAIDALGCCRLDAPHGVTTSAYSLNPATGRPYGPDFPAITVADMVESQRRVLDMLGIGRLVAVAGPSMGAMQALCWGARHPERVERVVAAIGLAEFQAREMGLYHAMEEAIRLDPAFEDGRYAPDAPPSRGLGLALKLMMLMAGGREELASSHGRAPGASAEWAIEDWLVRESAVRSRVCDANAWIGLLRVNMRWDLPGECGSLAKLAARLPNRVLLIPGAGDELVPPGRYLDPLAAALGEAGAEVRVAPLPPRNGHMAGLLDIAHAADAIRACLDS